MILRKLCLLLLVFASFGCNSDDEDPITIADDEFGYDGPNSTSPFLPQGNYEAAAYFPAGVLADQAGKSLKDINFYLLALPSRCTIKVYGPGTINQPGNVIYEQDVTDRPLQAPGWNRFRIDQGPLDVIGQDFWISIAFSHDGQNPQQSIGCDAGPNVEGGDWTFFGSDGQWQTFRQRAGGESINWNIRGILD